jgi:hypothetical protein
MAGRTAWEHILKGDEPEEGLNDQRSRLLNVLAQRASRSPDETVQDRIDRLCRYYHDVLFHNFRERGLPADGQMLGKIAQAITTEIGAVVIVTFIPMTDGMRLVGYALPMPPISAETRAILERAQVATLKRLRPGVI